MSKEPPVVLVKTWISLLRSNEDKLVKDRAKEMLLDAFGDMANVAEYCVRHDIKIK